MTLPQESTQTTVPPGDRSAKNIHKSGTVRIVSYADLDHATVFPHLAKIKYQCFGVGKPFLGCLNIPEKDLAKQLYTLYGEDGKAKYPESKLKMMGIAVSDDENENDGQPRYLGFIQITFADLPADMEIPLASLQHKCKENECYVEQVGVDGNARGLGVGTLLMNWAEEQTKNKFGPNPNNDAFLSLEVVRCNTGAIRVYERLGYKIVQRGCLKEMMTSCFTIPFIGHRGTHLMVKDL